MSLTVLVTTLVVVATLGAGALYPIGAGLARGRSAGFVAALGCTLGIVPPILTWLRRSFAGTDVLLAGRLALADR